MVVEVEPLFHYPMRILMTADIAGTKSMQKSTYNPIPKIKMLLLTMGELDPGLMVTAINGKSTLHTGQDKFPITKMAFKKVFSCDWETNGKCKKISFNLDAKSMATAHLTTSNTPSN